MTPAETARCIALWNAGTETAAMAEATRCTTAQEKTLGRLQTLCDDGTRAVRTWNRTLERWESTVSQPPGKTCTGQLNPHTRQVEGARSMRREAMS